MTTGVAAVQSRMSELRQLVAPTTSTVTAAAARTTSTTAAASTSTDFAAALAALGLSASDVTGDLGTSTGALAGATGTAGTAGLATGLAGASGATGQGLVAAAEKYVGVPYVWGGESLAEGGLDCSGLVQRALGDVGVTGVPRVARDQMTLGTAVPSLDQALPGDLLVFSGGSHIAIYVGDGKMIDAPKPGKTVAVRDVYATPTTIRRVLPQAGATTSSGTTSVAAARLAAQLASVSAQRTALGLGTALDTSGTTSAGATDTASWALGVAS